VEIGNHASNFHGGKDRKAELNRHFILKKLDILQDTDATIT
jgi:hypothetical protein